MKKTDLINFLNWLKETNITIVDMEELLQENEKVLDILTKISKDKRIYALSFLQGLNASDEYKLEVLRFISKTKFNSTSILNFASIALKNKELINKGISIDVAKIGCMSENANNTMYLNAALAYLNMFKKDEILEALRIIASCKKEYQTQYTTYTLLNAELIEKGINFEAAKLLSTSKSVTHAKYGTDILGNEELLKLNESINALNILLASPTDMHARYNGIILQNKERINDKTYLEAAKIINKIKKQENIKPAAKVINSSNKNYDVIKEAEIVGDSINKINAECASTILTDEELIEKANIDEILEVVNLISKNKSELSTKFATKIITDPNTLEDSELVIKMSHIIAKSNIENTNQLKEFLNRIETQIKKLPKHKQERFNALINNLNSFINELEKSNLTEDKELKTKIEKMINTLGKCPKDNIKPSKLVNTKK